MPCSIPLLLVFLFQIIYSNGLVSHCIVSVPQSHHVIMVSVLAKSVVDRGFELRSDKPKNIKLVYFAPELSIQH
jgi:hypothetical protein